MTNLSLSPLSASEAQGITVSLISAEFGEMGVVTYATAAGARSNFEHALAKNSRLGIVPRTQGAVAILAEVLA